MLYAVRGAITVSQDDAQTIQQAVATLLDTVLAKNAIQPETMIALWFTVTPDLTAQNPAQAIRHARPDFQTVPMLCAQEPVITDMLPRCIRVLVQWESDAPITVHPVYLGDAAHLRPDWAV